MGGVTDRKSATTTCGGGGRGGIINRARTRERTLDAERGVSSARGSPTTSRCESVARAPKGEPSSASHRRGDYALFVKEISVCATPSLDASASRRRGSYS